LDKPSFLRAFLVLGAESSGTRLATRILMSAGCIGSDGHSQPFDTEEFGDAEMVVWRRSVPHRGEWLDLGSMLNRCMDRDINVVVTMRDWSCVEASQRVRGHATQKEDVQSKLRMAYSSIFGQLTKYSVPYVALMYESLVLHSVECQCTFLKALRLPEPKIFTDVSDRDAARFHGDRPCLR
jgi:hypothetical protein